MPREEVVVLDAEDDVEGGRRAGGAAPGVEALEAGDGHGEERRASMGKEKHAELADPGRSGEQHKDIHEPWMSLQESSFLHGSLLMMINGWLG